MKINKQELLKSTTIIADVSKEFLSMLGYFVILFFISIVVIMFIIGIIMFLIGTTQETV